MLLLLSWILCLCKHMGILIRRSAILDRLHPSDIYFTVVVGLVGWLRLHEFLLPFFVLLIRRSGAYWVRACVCISRCPCVFVSFWYISFQLCVDWMNCVCLCGCVYVFVYLDLLFVVGFSRCMFVLFLLLMYSNNNHHITSPLSSSDTSTSTIELVWSKLYVFVQWLTDYWR